MFKPGTVVETVRQTDVWRETPNDKKKAALKYVGTLPRGIMGLVVRVVRATEDRPLCVVVDVDEGDTFSRKALEADALMVVHKASAKLLEKLSVGSWQCYATALQERQKGNG